MILFSMALSQSVVHQKDAVHERTISLTECKHGQTYVFATSTEYS
jgi:hypothetical protein